VPAAQSLHTLLLVACVAFENVPPGQLLHANIPRLAANVPAVQSEQTDLPFPLNVPSGHSVQLTLLLFAEYVPGGQGKHERGSAAPALGL
jgi:hypothetical protein